MESRVAYASRGKDLLHRFAGKVELDRIVEVTRVEWSGHVYNLTTVEGWYDANGIIVSNCDCRNIPASESVAGDLTVDPHDYFASLSPEQQDRIFTKAGAEAIRNGADVNQVVNARRGMRAAQVGGRDVLITSEGTTRRGLAYHRLSQSAGQDIKAGRYRSARRPRLMPETIRAIATDQADYLRLLRANGYLI